MGLGNLKSETIIGDETIDSVEMNTVIYNHYHSLECQPKEKPTQGLADIQMKHQKIERVKPPKPNPNVPVRGSMKNAAQAIHDANDKALKERGITPAPKTKGDGSRRQRTKKITD